MSGKEISVVIENPSGSTRVKYEIAKPGNRVVVDRFRRAGMAYPGNYGFLPDTLSPDGDPLDVLVVETIPIQPGAEIAVIPIGVLFIEDDGGMDDKIIAVPAARLQSDFSAYEEYADLPAGIRSAIEHFFKHYKDNEPGKWTKLHGIGNAADAWRIIDESYDRIRRNLPPAPPQVKNG